MKYEEVSAFVDGEIPAPNCAPLIDQVSTDHNARQSWGRYHLIGDVIRAHNFADNRAAEPVNYRASPPSVSTFQTPTNRAGYRGLGRCARGDLHFE